MSPRLPCTAGVANISNCLTIDTQMDLQHPDLLSEAKSRGLWDGSGDLSFKQVGPGCRYQFQIFRTGLLSEVKSWGLCNGSLSLRTINSAENLASAVGSECPSQS